MAKRKLPPNPILSERIKETRQWIKNGSKMTQSELAEIIGVEEQTIRKYERGKNGIPQTSVVAIANAFGCCVEYLMGETNCFTVEEYRAEEEQIALLWGHAARVQDERDRQWHITKDFFKTFLKCNICNTYKTEPDGSIIPSVLIEEQQGVKSTFLSKRDAEHFLLTFYEEVAKLLRYHLLDYNNIKTVTKPTRAEKNRTE